jgi:hypothetical protein
VAELVPRRRVGWVLWGGGGGEGRKDETANEVDNTISALHFINF